MSSKGKQILLLIVVFGAGLGIGGAGGFVLNDIVEREDPDAIQQIREEMQTQQNLDDIFAQQRAERNETEGSGQTP